MNRAHVVFTLAALAAATGCTSSNPSQPTTNAPAASADATASIAAPRPVTPANSSQIRNVDQPVTVVVQNAITTGSSAPAYTFEIASDAAFANRVQTWNDVAQGSGGQTSVRLDQLAAARDYWWHARAAGGGTTGVFGPAYKFTIGPAITINAPVPIAPLTGARTNQRPPLRVINAVRTGPVGAITYRFEISPSPTFNPITVTATNTEGVNETGYAPVSDLAANTGYFWRAFAIDAANGVTSPASPVQSFVTADSLWPNEVPPGGTGNAVRGLGWETRTVTAYPGLPIQTTFVSPRLELSRFFDLLDRGFTPTGALDWMNSHGYRTEAVWYPDVQVAGFAYEYVAFVRGTWELVIRVGG
jgi:hypothetical protein